MLPKVLCFLCLFVVFNIDPLGSVDEKDNLKINIPECSELPTFEDNTCCVPPPSKIPPKDL